MKQALLMRYSLIPFWYTLHYQAAMLSKTLVQPLHFEYHISDFLFFFKLYEPLRFPNDNKTLGIDQQFLIGRAILVSPNLVSVNINTRSLLYPSCFILKTFLEYNYSTCLYSTRCLVSISIRC
jgi:alpha-glucosidase